ncbi:MAG: hypothetical protein IJX88_06285 [Clostridia bacterium]|nr:hypothetical protein [Clostridia bacterium]
MWNVWNTNGCGCNCNCNSCGSCSGYNGCSLFNTLFNSSYQSICRDCNGNICVRNSCGYGCGCGCNGNDTDTDTTGNGNGNGSNGNNFACFSVCRNFNGSSDCDDYYTRLFGTTRSSHGSRSSCGCGYNY